MALFPSNGKTGLWFEIYAYTRRWAGAIRYKSTGESVWVLVCRSVLSNIWKYSWKPYFWNFITKKCNKNFLQLRITIFKNMYNNKPPTLHTKFISTTKTNFKGSKLCCITMIYQYCLRESTLDLETMSTRCVEGDNAQAEIISLLFSRWKSIKVFPNNRI